MRPHPRVGAFAALGLSALTLSLSLPAHAVSVLVWDNDRGRTLCDPNVPTCGSEIGSEQGVVQSLIVNGITPVVTTDLPSDLTNFDGIFVCLGWRTTADMAGQITTAQDLQLHNFLTTGRPVYVEGNDFARDHMSSLLLTDFGARFNNDGNPSSVGTVDSLIGFANSYAQGMLFDFPFRSPQDNFPDDVLPCLSPCRPGVLLFDDQNGPGKGVSYPSESGAPAGHRGGRGATSFLTVTLASFIDGPPPSTRREFMRRTIGYFGLGATSVDPLNGTTWGTIKGLYR